MFSTSFAQDNTQVGLPEGAIARLGNGKTLASGSDDGTVLLWDWEKIAAKRKAEIKNKGK